jgi:plasmid stabilization system protein ParE
MPRLIWTPPALIGMQRSYRFLALKNKDAASRAVKAIRAGAQLIAQHPEIGRPAEEMEPEYRVATYCFIVLTSRLLQSLR